MSGIQVLPPFQVFTDEDGDPLENGYIYIGQENLNPQVAPINVYWDPALTILAAQPIRTLGGYPARNGTPSRFFVNELIYSITVKNKKGELVFTLLDAQDSSLQMLGNNGAELIDYDGMPLPEALDVFPENFGAVGDGLVNDSAAFQAALDSLPEFGELTLKRGSTYKLVDGVDINVRGLKIKNNGARIYYPRTSATYFHCLRVNADDVSLIDLHVYSDIGLVRDDTGFAISIFHTFNTLVENCTLIDIASAAIWCTNSDNIQIINNNVIRPKADGIHFSDGCRNFVADGNVLTGTADDALAVVGDVPGDSLTPQQGVISNNTVDGTTTGHGVVLIACDTVNVIGNTIRATGAAGIGSYFWNLVVAPVDSDWANNCHIADNVIIAPGSGAVVADNVCGILAGAFRNSTISNNVVSGPVSESLALAAVIRVTAMQNLCIDGNTLQDSLSYGVWSPDTNANGAVNHTELTIRNNRFYNVAKEIVRVSTAAANVGSLLIENNHAFKSVYDGATTVMITVTKTAGNLLAILGNRNIDGNKPAFFDPVTCTNVRVGDNLPDALITFAPNAVATTGSWTTASSTGSYVIRGNLVFFRVDVTVTTKGAGTGMKFDLPKPIAAGLAPCQITGLEVTTLGTLMAGNPISTTQVSVATYNNSDPVTGNGQVVQINGWYQYAL